MSISLQKHSFMFRIIWFKFSLKKVSVTEFNLNLTNTILSYIIFVYGTILADKTIKRSENMTREFIYTEPFRRAWGSMGLDDGDIK